MEKILQYEGKDLFYHDIGDGPTVLLLHGFGEDGTVWNNQVEFLKNKYRLIIPDIPGSGKSEMIKDMSIEGLGDAAAHILQSVTSKSPLQGVRGFGHSMGGYITLALVEKYPSLVSSFGLIHSSAFADTDEKKATRKKGIAFIKENGPMEFLKTAIPNLFSDDSKAKHPSLVKDFIATLPNFSAEALVAYYEAMMARPARTHVLKNASVPVLFLLGKHDTAIPLLDGLKQSHLPGISYIHILENSGHMGMLEQAEETNRILDEFLQETENPRTPN